MPKLFFGFLFLTSTGFGLKLLQQKTQWDREIDVEHELEQNTVAALAQFGFRARPQMAKCTGEGHTTGRATSLKKISGSRGVHEGFTGAGPIAAANAALAAGVALATAGNVTVGKIAPLCAKAAAAHQEHIKYFTIAVTSAEFQCWFYLNCGSVTPSSDPATGSWSPWFIYDRAAISWAKNDPEVSNVLGESFDIMQTGTFLMLSIPDLESSKPLMKIDATIDRAGSRCGATYIQNLTLSGTSVEELGSPYIAMRAHPVAPKAQAFEVNTEGTWKRSSYWKKSVKNHFLESSSNSFLFRFHDVEVFVSIDSHRIVEHGTKGRRFANFLNLNVKGLSRLGQTNIGGLLGTDEHEYAMQLPQGCSDSSAKLLETSRSKPHLLSKLTAAEA